MRVRLNGAVSPSAAVRPGIRKEGWAFPGAGGGPGLPLAARVWTDFS